MAERFPKPAFDLQSVRKFEPPVSRSAQALAFIVLLVMLQCAGMFLWFAGRMPATGWAWGAGLMLAAMWVQGALLQARVSVRMALVLFAALAVALALSPLSQWISFVQYNQEFFGFLK